MHVLFPIVYVVNFKGVAGFCAFLFSPLVSAHSIYAQSVTPSPTEQLHPPLDLQKAIFGHKCILEVSVKIGIGAQPHPGLATGPRTHLQHWEGGSIGTRSFRGTSDSGCTDSIHTQLCGGNSSKLILNYEILSN